MATMIRVKPLNLSGAVVSAGAVTLGVCLADEIAVMVGDAVPRYRCGSELREALKLWANRPRSAPAVAGGSVRAFVAAPGVNGDALEAAGATVLATVVPNEAQIGIIVGATAAAALDRSSLLRGAIAAAIDRFVGAFGV